MRKSYAKDALIAAATVVVGASTLINALSRGGSASKTFTVVLILGGVLLIALGSAIAIHDARIILRWKSESSHRDDLGEHKLVD